MKANELMIGDFVFHEKYGNTIIETIDYDFGDNPYVKLISENIKHKNGYKYGYCWCDLDEIFPIPITPEILEKNGFVLEDYSGDFMLGKWWTRADFVISEGMIDSVGKNNFIYKYVHQLQHALRLCGIEKTIEL